MPLYFIIGLEPGDSPISESDVYARNTQHTRVVLATAEGAPLSGNLGRVQNSICREITYTELNPLITRDYNQGGNGRVNVPDLDWLDSETMHAPNLESSLQFKYWGKYFPAVSYWDGLYVRTSVVSLEGFDCAHCALLEARRIAAAENALPAPNYATVLHISPDHEVMEPNSGWTGLMGDSGQIEVGSATTKLEFDGSGCGYCGFPGHNRSTCPRGVGSRSYDRVGVEIEGRWFNRNQVQDAAIDYGCGACGDSSIRAGYSAARALEIQTKPGTVTEALRQLAKFYPDESDASCGMHVHVSFYDMCSISQLATMEFAAYFKRRWQEWGAAQNLAPTSQFFRRLNGSNEYCAPNDETDMDDPYGADRYLQLNFLAWNEHKTVECRLLPMFRDARLAYAALVELVSIYEDWLGRDCPAVLVGAECGIDAVVQIDPIVNVTAVDLTPYEVSPMSLSVEVDLADLPPVPDGFRRVCTTPAQRSQLSYLLAPLDADLWAQAA